MVTDEQKREQSARWKACGDGWCRIGAVDMGWNVVTNYSHGNPQGWVELCVGRVTDTVDIDGLHPNPEAPGNLGIIMAQVREFDGCRYAHCQPVKRGRFRDVEYRMHGLGRDSHSGYHPTEFAAWLSALEWLTKGKAKQ